MFPHDPERDAGVRAWRLAQVDGAMACEKRLGPDTVVLPTDDASPWQLAERILAEADQHAPRVTG
jgi:hypothetical protein